MAHASTCINRIAVGDIIRRAASRYPGKVAVVDGTKRITYRELDHACNQFANYLLSRDLQPGERVACVCQNSLEYLVVMYGIAKAGLVWVPVNPLLAPSDIEYILQHSEASLLVADDLVYAKLAAIPTVAELPDIVTVPLGQTGAAGHAITLAEALENQPAAEPAVDIHQDDLALIMYTSGTTSRPKGVMQTHLSVYIATLSSIIEVELSKEDVATTMMPLFHCAQHCMTASILHVGATAVVLRGFDPVTFAETVEREKITWMFALPVMYRAMLNHPEVANKDLSSLRYCMYAMTPMDEDTLRRAIDRFEARFALGTGQTEMYPGTMFFKPEEQLRRFGSYWGVSAVAVDTAIMDDEGNLLEHGQIGEIVHRGPTVMKGYWKNAEATAEAQKFGWHHTGDLGVFDQDGQLLFVDRKKDMIKTGGENVPSIKIESILLKQQCIANAAVVGLPHERWGEAITAFVTVQPGKEVDAEEILEHCRRELAGFEVPKAVIFLQQFPLTATGKIQKNLLREQYAGHYAPTQG